MKFIMTKFYLLICLITFGQKSQVQELSELYMSGDFDQTITKAKEFLKNDPNNVDYNLLLGRALTDKNEFKSAIPYLVLTVNNDRNNSWRKAWAFSYLGTCYFMLQNCDDSESSLNDCIKLNVTKNATNSAYGQTLLFGFNEFYKTWKIVETDNFRFHFQNMTDNDIKKYISTREEAFQNINNFFDSKIPKKIDFFVWHSRDDAKKLLRANLGFAKPRFCVLHSQFQQTKGHEMTHVISNYSTEIIKKTGLINEGTSVCFDQTNQDKEQIVKDWLKNNDKKITIREIWTNWKVYPEELTYPLSGLFVKELIDNFGSEKFIKFFGNQTYDNAKLIFGEKLDEVIKDFENKLNT